MKEASLVIPAVCTIWQWFLTARERLHRSREAAEHPHPPEDTQDYIYFPSSILSPLFLSCCLSQLCTEHYQKCWGCGQADRRRISPSHLPLEEKLQGASLSSSLRMLELGPGWLRLICLSILCLCLCLPSGLNARRAPKIPRCPATCSCTKDSAFCVDTKAIPKSFPPGIISL